MGKGESNFLGDYVLEKKTFSGTDELIRQFKVKKFLEQADRKKSDEVNLELLKMIQKEPSPCFLLAAVLDFVEKIDREGILLHYKFTSFEIWLNHFSGLNFEENYLIRAKIAGKYVERDDYQALFPIGMGKVYEGTHFVTAHKSPDLDTTVASFWGWLDAFAARVGNSLHVWNLPGGPPPSQIEIEWLFSAIFGDAVFTHLAKKRSALTLTGNDLMTQEGLQKKEPDVSITALDHERAQTAIVIVDQQGYYLGDWRSMDVEGVRQVIILLSSCVRWFENTLHLHLISLFSKKDLKLDVVKPSLEPLFKRNLENCEPADEFTPKQKKQVHDFIVQILGVKEGIHSTFEDLGNALAKLSGVSLNIENLFEAIQNLFDRDGNLVEDRPQIFTFLEKIVRALHEAILKSRRRLEKLDIALQTKIKVFDHQQNYVTVRSDVEEIKSKMSVYPYLTVAYPDGGKLYPVGIIQAKYLRRAILGTVSLRDFCNPDEMSIPSYLDVISVIDHHKSTLKTFSPPLAIIADAQSSNSLVAERAFQINDRYSLAGQSKEEIQKAVDAFSKDASSKGSRLLQRALTRKVAFFQGNGHFIHPDREFIEYLHFLYAILDDTDLLTKVSLLDIHILAALLNRLKSLQLKKEVEIIHFDGLSKQKDFLRAASLKILKNDDMYSLYKKVYEFREKEVEKNIKLTSEGKDSNFFADTKEQNGCARIGQTKMFDVNVPLFEKHADAIRKTWFEKSKEEQEKKGDIDLYLHMISTIVSAEEVYKGTEPKHSHLDELWIWAPVNEMAIEHLKRFLNAFRHCPSLKGNLVEVEFFGENQEEYGAIFQESFSKISQKKTDKNIPIAVLRYKAGAINSRKSMISPYLPTLVS